MANSLSIEKRERIFNLLCEGNGIRSVSRIVGCSVNTVTPLQERYSNIVGYLNRKFIRDLEGIEEIEADEIRTFVYNKTNLRWVYIALDRKSRMVIHFHVGKRDTKSAREFMLKLCDKCCGNSILNTDNLKSYISGIESSAEGYNPTNSLDVVRSTYFGKKLGRTITNRIETHNGNVRQHVACLARRTRCFAKTDDGLFQRLNLFFFYYNFMKRHKSIKTAPCVAAGLIEKRLSFKDLLVYDAMLFDEAPINRPKTYKKKKARVIKLFSTEEIATAKEEIQKYKFVASISSL